MKKLVFIIVLALLGLETVCGQTDSINIISEQIRFERDNQLMELSENLKKNEDEVKRLQEILSGIDDSRITEKVRAVEELHLKLDDRIKILETAPITKINHNGQLAFTELLSVQRDIQPADLFIASSSFFNELGNIGNFQNYNEFKSWKTKYDRWYQKQKSGDPFLELVNNSVNLISNTASIVPLYGSIAQSVSSGISTIMYSLGSKDKELSAESSQMLPLLNTVSQFEQQKSLIDHEWVSINNELKQLQQEYKRLISDQLKFYGLDSVDYRKRYIEETLDSKRDEYKNFCRKKISERMAQMDADKDHRGKWMGEVETYMYQVQSIRLRFGQLTSRMLSNINRYEQLIAVYSDDKKFPSEFTTKIKSLATSLSTVKGKFYTTFNPMKYIEDSAVMYIERIPD